MTGSIALLALVLVAGLGGAFLFSALRFPGGAILGSLATAYLTASLMTTPIELPKAAVVGAQIGIGVIVASSVTGSVWARVRSRYRSSMLLAVVIIAIGLSFGIALNRIFGAPLAVMLMGTIPGGASDVSAIVIDLDEAFAVAAIFQILRQAAVFLTIGIVLHSWQRGRTV